ncbi:hypothetical protein Poly51_48480 [Rubripirellula tenax]|uniref:Uncharacterized protein n=1 Tax=Rubripirellula tenax TaxID=2528015 RepID=A0A5C6EKC3_9BACT|nr:DUF2178 domain-containing protein [Rubripirellula tenax]TWU48944.1 hypothetical protein Poly51_48480 [Rubripirellula tenax]
MNALEKVAWTELVVSVLAIVVVLALYPWLGGAAMGGFGLLGLLGVTPIFMRKRGSQVASDERDQQIERQASWRGFGTAWMLMVCSLAAIMMWHSHHQRDISPGLLSMVIWIQFAFCYAIKGASSLIQYRGNHRAA